MHVLILISLFGVIQLSWAKAVFAHFMLANAQNYTSDTWAEDIKLAQQAHIQGFALNLAYNPGDDLTSVTNDAFETAAKLDFSLFFSFDYGPSPKWPKATVIDTLQHYGSSPAYTRYQDKLLISTFEGADNADDWIDIKDAAPCAGNKCFFMPSWSSIGAKAALQRGNGVADGLFNWGAWPTAPDAMTTSVDEDYISNLGGKPYMMAVSPCFYTNLPIYSKNWLWEGDHLWVDRWDQVQQIQPEFVEVLTWNDYGESHYIGPVRDNALAALAYGGAPFDYAISMPHDGWRATLPYSVDAYLSRASSTSSEALSVWFRPNPVSASNCNDGKTTANTASQGQTPMAPRNVLQDRIFFSVLSTTKPTSLTVTIGGADVTADWIDQPQSGSSIRLWHGNTTLISGQTGEVVVTVTAGRSSLKVSSADGISPCSNGWTNFNYWTGSDSGSRIVPTRSSVPLPARTSSSCKRSRASSNHSSRARPSSSAVSALRAMSSGVGC